MADKSLVGILGGKPDKPKLFIETLTGKNLTRSSREITVHVLIQYLLNGSTDPSIKEKFKTCQSRPILTDIDHESKIIQVEIHRQRGKPNTNNSTKPPVIFVVFQTASDKDGECWWSLEKTAKNAIVLQRSRDKHSVTNKFKGEMRQETQLIAENLEGKGCMRELLTLLWIHTIVNVKYQRNLSRCESVIPLIMKKITQIGYECKANFKYSALSAEEKNPELSDLIDFLSNVSKWHPLVIATYLGDAELLDRLKQDGQYNINGIYNSFTLLNVAILFDQTQMIQHLLLKCKADPQRSDKKGRNALHMAAKFNREKKIIELLLNKIFIDQFDKTGTTALHHAIMASNTEIVEFLLDNGADHRKKDQIGRCPLCLAAFYASDTRIIDLLLLKKGIVDINEGDKFGVTALHHAAIASNVTTARHLLARGADINRPDNRGVTPLHVAAFHAKDMDLIDLFLDNKKVDLHYCDKFGLNVIAYAQKNTYGLGRDIIERVNKIDDRVIDEYNSLKLAKFEMQIPSWKSLVWRLLPSLTAVPSLALKENKQKLFLVPHADVKPGKGDDIPELSLIQFLAQPNSSESRVAGMLSVIDPSSNITQVHIYSSSNNSVANFIRAVDSFIVFQTTSKKDGIHWWSLDKNADYIVLQRSRSLDTVTNKFAGKERKDVKFNAENLVGKGSIRNLFEILWIHQVMEEFINRSKNSNSPSFVTFVSRAITARDDEDDFTHQMDWINIFSTSSGIPKLHPLFLAIYVGYANLFGRIKETVTKYNADPTTRAASGRKALEMAAIDAENVSNLILENQRANIDGCDQFDEKIWPLELACRRCCQTFDQKGLGQTQPVGQPWPLSTPSGSLLCQIIVDVLLNAELVCGRYALFPTPNATGTD